LEEKPDLVKAHLGGANGFNGQRIGKIPRSKRAMRKRRRRRERGGSGGFFGCWSVEGDYWSVYGGCGVGGTLLGVVFGFGNGWRVGNGRQVDGRRCGRR
jgi:hypothetical protein